MGQLIAPAPGMKFLTTRQIIELDDYLATASAAMRGQGAILSLVMDERGLLRQFCEPLPLNKIKLREA